MPRFIALLRGINVGGHRVKMDRLRGLFEALDYAEVATFIASGNVIFSAPSSEVTVLENQVETHLARELGYEVATFIRTPAELARTGEVDAFGAAGDPNHSRYVLFLKEPADSELRSVFADLRTELDDFRFIDREIHWRIRGKLTESAVFGPALDRATRRVPMTMRNMTTVRRLVTRIQPNGTGG